MVAFADPKQKPNGNQAVDQKSQDSSVTQQDATISTSSNRSQLIAPESGLFRNRLNQAQTESRNIEDTSATVGKIIGGDGLIGRGIADAGKTVADLNIGAADLTLKTDQFVRGKINAGADAIQETGEKIVTGVTEAKDKVVDTVVATKDAIVDGAIQAKDDLVNLAVDTKNQVVNTVVEAKNNTVDLVVDTKNLIVDGAVQVKNDAVEMVVSTKDAVVDTAVELKDNVVATAKEVKENVLVAVDATINSVQAATNYVSEAPSKIAGWFASKIKNLGSSLGDQMTEVAKDLGGDGLIGKAGASLAQSVESGFNGTANVVDKTDDAMAYMLTGGIQRDISKQIVSSLATTHSKSAEVLANLTANIANISDTITDKTLLELASTVRTTTKDLARTASETGRYLAGDGLVSKPFELASSLYLGLGEQVAGSLDSFGKVIDGEVQDAAKMAQKWKVWSEMTQKKTAEFNYEYQKLTNKPEAT